MTRRLLFALALLVILAPAAQAAPFTPKLERAYNLAVKYWGEPEGCSSVDRQIVPDGSLPEGRAAEATIPEPGTIVPCLLFVSRSLARPKYFAFTCTVIIHEMGHLHGLEHSSERGNVMNPEHRKVPRICDLSRFRYHSRTLNDR